MAAPHTTRLHSTAQSMAALVSFLQSMLGPHFVSVGICRA